MRVKNFLAFHGTYKYYPSGPVNHFVKRCLLRRGIDSLPLASKIGGMSAVHDPMSTVFTTACRILRPYFFTDLKCTSRISMLGETVCRHLTAVLCTRPI